LRSWETKSKGSGEKLSREKVWSSFENVPRGTFEHWNRSWSLSLRIVFGAWEPGMRFPQRTRRAKKKSFWLFEFEMFREFLDRTRILKSKGWCLRGFFLKMFHVEHSKIAGRSEYLNRECDDLSYWSHGWGLRSWETKSKGSGEKLSREKVWSSFENVPRGTFEHWNRSWSLSLRIVFGAWESQAWDSLRQQGEQRKRVSGYWNLRCAGSSWIERGYWSQRDDVSRGFFLKNVPRGTFEYGGWCFILLIAWVRLERVGAPFDWKSYACSMKQGMLLFVLFFDCFVSEAYAWIWW